MRWFSSALVVVFAFFAAATASADAVEIPRVVPYASGSGIPENIKTECTDLGEKLGSFLKEYAEKAGVETRVVDAVDPKARGRVLRVEITGAISSGNAFIGHNKSMSVRGELFVDGISKGQVDFTRNSGGGFAGGYKGSCAVLGRCTKALGNDLAKWLEQQ